MQEFKLTDLLEVNVLQQIQDGFSQFTGMASIITDTEGIPVTKGSGFTKFCAQLTRKTELGNRRCEKCDRDGALLALKEGKPAVYSCHAGLVDYAAPIMLDGQFIGCVVGGQIRTGEIDLDFVRKYADELGIDRDAYVQAVSEIKLLSQTAVTEAARFLSEIAQAMSREALRNYNKLGESHKMERAARSQTSFIMDFCQKEQQVLKNWTDDINEVLTDENSANMADTLKKLSQYIKDMDAVIDDTLSYIRMTSGKLELLETEYLVSELVGHIEKEFTNTEDEEKQNINLSVTMDENVPNVLMGDSGRIGQVITSVIQNLVRSTGNNNVELRIMAKPTSYAVSLLIRIEDVGTCLETEQKNMLFKRIESEELQAVDMIEEGNMGMSVARILTKRMAGKILVEQGTKGNATVTISLPQLVIKGGNC